MKFECDNCSFENWLEFDLNEFKREKVLLYCCDCGYVQGYPDSEEIDENNDASCACIPFEGFERKETTGPIGSGKITDNETRWGTSSGDKNGLKRNDFMSKFGWDPLTTWCIKMPHARAQWKGFEKRCEARKRIKPDEIILPKPGLR